MCKGPSRWEQSVQRRELHGQAAKGGGKAGGAAGSWGKSLKLWGCGERVDGSPRSQGEVFKAGQLLVADTAAER